MNRIAREDLFYTRNRKAIVTASSPAAFFVFARAGEVVGGSLIERYGLEDVVDTEESDHSSVGEPDEKEEA